MCVDIMLWQPTIHPMTRHVYNTRTDTCMDVCVDMCTYDFQKWQSLAPSRHQTMTAVAYCSSDSVVAHSLCSALQACLPCCAWSCLATILCRCQQATGDGHRMTPRRSRRPISVAKSQHYRSPRASERCWRKLRSVFERGALLVLLCVTAKLAWCLTQQSWPRLSDDSSSLSWNGPQHQCRVLQGAIVPTRALTEALLTALWRHRCSWAALHSPWVPASVHHSVASSRATPRYPLLPRLSRLCWRLQPHLQR